MSSLGNKDIMAKNLKYYIERSGKDRRELSEIWGFPYSTVTEWINGKKYPRIDRIEVMADYFGILKSDLIEDKGEEHKKTQADNAELADIIIRLRTDEDFRSAVVVLNSMEKEKVKNLLALLQ